jgi:dGTPase
MIRFSSDMRRESSELKRFLLVNLYRHPQVMETTGRARQIVAGLYAAYCAEPSEMRTGQGAGGEVSLRRRVADYIAGMTDRFAIREHERLTGQRLFT